MLSLFSSSPSSSLVGPETWPWGAHTLVLRLHSAQRLQLATSQSTYCKVYIGEAPVVNASHGRLSSMFSKKSRANEPKNRSFHSSVSTSQDKTVANWNEEYEVPVEDFRNDILSIRVKSKTPVYPLSIGSCAIQLAQLHLGSSIDQEFPLFKGEKTVGTIRLELTLRKTGVVNEPAREKRTSKTKRTKHMDARSEDDLVQEEEHAEFLRRQREQEQQLLLERQRIEERMEQLRREEEECLRRRQEEDERRRIEAERVAALEAQKRRSKVMKHRPSNQLIQEQEERMVQRISHNVNRRKSKASNQDANASFEDQWRSPFVVSTSPADGRTRRPTLALTEIIDSVVHDALPSDSDDSNDTDSQGGLDSEDEQEFIREIARLKVKMIQKRKQRQRDSQTLATEAQQPPRRNSRTNGVMNGSKIQQNQRSRNVSSSSGASRTVRSPSSGGTSGEDDDDEDEEEGEVDEEEEYKPVYQPVAVNWGDRRSRSPVTNQVGPGYIQSMTPSQISQKNGQDQVSPLTIGQVVGGAVSVVGTAVSVAAFVAGEGDAELPSVEGAYGTAVGALKSLVPVGKFVGQKIHEATAMVAQLNGPSANDAQPAIIPALATEPHASPTTQATYYF